VDKSEDSRQLLGVFFAMTERCKSKAAREDFFVVFKVPVQEKRMVEKTTS